ncbi:diguanylate cyclase [Gracilibacillus caseinilyticus]|uniref:Diguanylate cyclase n=1 Tax=Gracilibacillus caseinilyticus TaxID=2932256 RepID=A0ABY4F1B5_9BACI|nr:diguanylate cyclase [Gracilibacillus caseinilyticus]UOQ48221.1 diguanylate cyclase [Gracilibacillus caseinilyticus]
MMDLVYQPNKKYNILDLIWTNTTDAIFAIDYRGAVIDANPVFNHMLGWELEELHDITFPPFITNMTEEEHQSLLSNLKDGQDFPYEVAKRRSKHDLMLDILASYWSVNDKRILAIGMYKDFTEQLQIQRQLEESEYCYRTLVEYLPEVIVKQRNNKIEFANSSAVKLFGKQNLEDIAGQSIWDFITSERRVEIQHVINNVYVDDKLGVPKTLIGMFALSDGTEIDAEVKIIPIGSKKKPDIQIVFRDVTEKKKYEQQLEHLAYQDPLTGLKNRRSFTEIVTESIEIAKKENKKVALMYIDIDKFKAINDTFGHNVSDQLLQQFATRLKSCVRNGDALCRVGGDEFLVLLKEITLGKETIDVAERMHTMFQKPYEIDGLSIHVTSSIGIALFPDNGGDFRTLIHRADDALYQAKVDRNQYVFNKEIK